VAEAAVGRQARASTLHVRGTRPGEWKSGKNRREEEDSGKRSKQKIENKEMR
jgi:hypothetical protein